MQTKNLQNKNEMLQNVCLVCRANENRCVKPSAQGKPTETLSVCWKPGLQLDVRRRETRKIIELVNPANAANRCGRDCC
jgi:hypothetical protein